MKTITFEVSVQVPDDFTEALKWYYPGQYTTALDEMASHGKRHAELRALAICDLYHDSLRDRCYCCGKLIPPGDEMEDDKGKMNGTEFFCSGQCMMENRARLADKAGEWDAEAL